MSIVRSPFRAWLFSPYALYCGHSRWHVEGVLGGILLEISRARSLAFLAAAAAAAVPTAAFAQSPAAEVTLRVGSLFGEFAADIFYGIDQGFFQRAGIKIDLQMFTNGAATSAAILGGSLDIGLTDCLTVAEGYLRGLDVVFIAPGAGFGKPWPMAFATRSDANISVAKDFNGKTMGILAVKNAASMMAYYWIDHNGGDSQSVKWVELPFPTAVDAIVDKRVDGYLLGEPFLTQARDAGLHITPLEHNTSADLWLVNGWVTTRAWADKNKDVVRRFIAAMHDANRWANTHVADTFPLIAQYTKIPQTTVERIMRHPWIETLQAPLVQPVIDTCAHYGVLSKTFPAKELFYTS
jgi:NitT/TauT family transport system substrate-binding protein